MKKKNNVSEETTERTREQFEKLLESNKNLKEQLARALADYQNLQKRTQEEKSSWIKIANKELILKLLPVMDNLFEAIADVHEENQGSPWFEGARLSALELKKILEDSGLEVIPSDSTTNFDPKIHEAIDVESGRKGEILKVVQMGYKLNGELIRPSKVIVGTGDYI